MNTIKKVISIAAILILLLNIVACKKDAPYTDPDKSLTFLPKAFISLDTLKSLFTYKDVTLTDNKITGIVISNPASKNIDSNYVIIQNKGYGITLSMDAVTAATYTTGDSLVIDINSSILTNVLGTTLIKGLGANAITKVASGKTIIPVTITLNELSAAFKRYEATLVRVLNTAITPLVATQTTFAGTKSLNDISGASTILLYTKPTAVFADSTLPSGATFLAIPFFYNTIGENTNAWADKRLYLRKITEVAPVVVIAAWQFSSPASAGTEVSYNATTTAINTNTSTLVRGSGYNPTALSKGFSSNVASTTITKDDAITNKAYYQFAISAKPGYSLSLAGITSRLRRSAAGAAAYAWTYSLDGLNFTNIGNDVSFTSTVDGVDQPPVDLSAVAALQNIAPGTTVTFRLYGWGFGNVGSGTFAIGRFSTTTTNSLTISGNLQ